MSAVPIRARLQWPLLRQTVRLLLGDWPQYPTIKPAQLKDLAGLLGAVEIYSLEQIKVKTAELGA